jgi:hypothetical protein
MPAGIWNIVFGLGAVAAAASGGFVLPGTHGPLPLVIAGLALAAWGGVQLARSRR